MNYINTDKVVSLAQNVPKKPTENTRIYRKETKINQCSNTDKGL